MMSMMSGFKIMGHEVKQGGSHALKKKDNISLGISIYFKRHLPILDPPRWLPKDLIDLT